MHFRISYTMNAEDIFRSSIGCEIMLMIKAKIRLIFSRYMYALVCTHVKSLSNKKGLNSSNVKQNKNNYGVTINNK